MDKQKERKNYITKHNEGSFNLSNIFLTEDIIN